MWTKEECSKWGKIGGSVKSKWKGIAVGINALKHGNNSKNEGIRKLITPTPSERILGITREDKIEEAKAVIKVLNAKNAIEFLDNYRTELLEAKARMTQWEEEKLKKGFPPSPHYRFIWVDKVSRFGELAFGLNPNNTIILNKIENKIDYTEILRDILGSPKIIETNFKEVEQNE